jgi:DNA-directed RNA polymerase specialized sigma subunit
MKNTGSEQAVFCDREGSQVTGSYFFSSSEEAEASDRQRQRLTYYVQRCIQEELTPRQREMLRLYIGQQLTKAQIARLLGVERPAVTRCLARAIDRLNHSVRKYLSDPDAEVSFSRFLSAKPKQAKSKTARESRSSPLSLKK